MNDAGCKLAYSAVRIIVLCTLCDLVSLNLVCAAEVHRLDIVFSGNHRSYYLYVPDSVKPEGKSPLLVLFHGSNRRGASLVKSWLGLSSREGIILVAPDSLNSAQWNPVVDSPEFIRQIIGNVLKYGVDKQRIYLFGHSAGGVYALYLSLIESQYYAATAVHAGAFLESAEPLVSQTRRKIPIAIWVGTNDSYVSPQRARSTKDMLEKYGFCVQLNEMAGYGHDYYSHANDINKSVWNFLRIYTLPQPS
jgi:poly(3-hydroxybutyrate) depolymerase